MPSSRGFSWPRDRTCVSSLAGGCSLAPPTEASKCYSHNYTQIHRAGHQTFTSKPPFLRLNHNKCADSWCSLSLSTHALKSLPPCGERAQGPCRGHMWCSDWHPQLSPSPSAHQSPWSMWMRKLTDDRSASQHLSAEPSQPPGLRDIIIINDHRCFVATWSSCAIIDNPNTDNLLCSSLRRYKLKGMKMHQFCTEKKNVIHDKSSCIRFVSKNSCIRFVIKNSHIRIRVRFNHSFIRLTNIYWGLAN